MKIRKIGHCCLVIKLELSAQAGNLTILTDPGEYSSGQDELTGIDLVLITHEHPDHLHIESLEKILKNNKDAQIVTNSSVGKILTEKGIKFSLLEGRDTIEIKGVALEAFDCRHEEIYGEVGQVKNTGYFIQNKLFYPGDSFYNPEKPVDILALPVAGPWCTIKGVLNYALAVKPKKAFPVHDGMLYPDRRGLTRVLPTKVLKESGIEFINMEEGEEKEF
ncbi:MAG: MBL fold metallo-hydrolase [Candidatus Taylorbacteria bacterium]|nr:MBL fold metallo-hydrolase [Candidatus Taylorbacteria bacterium]